jgi:hypothetical protein
MKTKAQEYTGTERFWGWKEAGEIVPTEIK